MVIETGRGTIRLAQSVIGRRTSDNGCIAGPAKTWSVSSDSENSLLFLTFSIVELP